jgi:surface polysaccharide O-acyltransferase-like enzyme
MWVAEALLLFAAVYVIWRILRPAADRTGRRLPRHRAMFLSALAVGATAFALRLQFPVGETVLVLQLGYFASYVFLFCVGAAAASGRWLERVGPELAVPWLIVSAFALLVLVGCFLAPGSGSYAGGWTIDAAIYAFFEPFFAWGVILGLLWLFRTRCNKATGWSHFLSARAYTVYIVHPPVLVGVALALQLLTAPLSVKFLLAGMLACAASLLVSSLILLVPGSRRVL